MNARPFPLLCVVMLLFGCEGEDARSEREGVEIANREQGGRAKEYLVPNAYWASEDVFASSPLIVGRVEACDPFSEDGSPSDIRIRVSEVIGTPDEDSGIAGIKVGDVLKSRVHKEMQVGDPVLLGFEVIQGDRSDLCMVGDFPMVIDAGVSTILQAIRKHGDDLGSYGDKELFDLYESVGPGSSLSLSLEVESRRRRDAEVNRR